ncbi:MAG: pilin [Zoogloeaceae bacterium]|nr:pilin [Zoogloeaceae bacterium]
MAAGSKLAVAEIYTNHGAWPANNEDADLAKAISITGKYVVSVTVTSGKIASKMKASGVAKDIENKTLTLRPIARGGSYEWSCKWDGLQKYMPASCR